MRCLGDLVLTCSSPQSRNMSLGLALGQGLSVEQALAGKRSVAEGYESAPAVRELTRKLGVDTPICEATAAVLALTGSAVGAPIALTTALVGLTGRTNAPVTLAALAALGVNTWAGRACTGPVRPGP